MKKLLLIICFSLPLVAAHKRSLESGDTGTPAKRVETEEQHAAQVPGSLVNRAAAVIAQNLALYENADIVDDLFYIIRKNFFGRYRNELLKKILPILQAEEKIFKYTDRGVVLKTIFHFTPNSTKLVGCSYKDLYVVDLVKNIEYSLPMPLTFDRSYMFTNKNLDVSPDSKQALIVTPDYLQPKLLVFDITQQPFLRTQINIMSDEIDAAIKNKLDDDYVADIQGNFVKWVNNAFISSDNQYIVVVVNGGMSILLFDFAGKLTQVVDTFDEQEDYPGNSIVTVSPEKNKVAFRVSDTVVRVADLDYKKAGTDDMVFYTDIQVEDVVAHMLFSPDSSKICLVIQDQHHQIPVIYDFDSGHKDFGRSFFQLNDMKWIDYDRVLVAHTRADFLYTFFTLQSFPPFKEWANVQRQVSWTFLLAVSLHDQLFAAFYNSRIHFFDSENDKEIGAINSDSGSLQFSPDGRYLLVSNSIVYDFESERLQEQLAPDWAELIELAKGLKVSGF